MLTTTEPKEALFALLHPVFRDCCGTGYRKDTATPFVSGGFVYATDSRVCVRSAATPEIVEAFGALPVDPGKPRVAKAHVPFEAFTEFRPGAVTLPPAPTDPCPRCGGSGVQPAYECEECGHEEDARQCRRCLGFGRGEGYREGEPFLGVCISHKVLILAEKHGAAVHRPGTVTPTSPFRLTLPGVEGRFMTMSPPDPDKESR